MYYHLIFKLTFYVISAAVQFCKGRYTIPHCDCDCYLFVISHVNGFMGLIMCCW